MKILKRNQVIISVLALMLITVGYMSYTSNIHDSVETGALMDAELMADIGDARLVNSDNISEDGDGNSEIVPNSSDNENNEDSDTNTDGASSVETAESAISSESENLSNGASASSTSTSKDSSTSSSSSESKTTSANNYGTDYFVTSKLERDKMYSQMLETYKGLTENSAIPAEQKSISTQEITNINNQKNSIMIAENLIKNLGFEDVVIFVNDNSTSVVVKAEKLEDADVAKIQNIVCREIGIEAEDIHISLK